MFCTNSFESILECVNGAVSLCSHQTCTVALELVYVLIDLNCEDVLLELVFKSA